MPRRSWLPSATRRALYYEPDPRGLRPAREAVCRYYRTMEPPVDPEQIFLTTSTSEAYSFLFRLLCDPGDEVLIGQPGYPLFDFLARWTMCGWFPTSSSTITAGTWTWRRCASASPRALGPSRSSTPIIPRATSPTAGRRAAIEALCREHGLALIVDEVFLDYGLDQRRGELCHG